MGRPVRKRIAYTADVAHLSRLREAIVSDERQSSTWKRELDEHLKRAIALLSTAEVVGNG